MKVIYGFAFFFLAGLSVAVGQTNCNPDIKYSVREKSSGASISLRSEETVAKAEITLYDLYSGVTVQTKKISLMNYETEIFAKVKNAVYVIFVRIEGCAKVKSIGGKEGIKVGNIE